MTHAVWLADVLRDAGLKVKEHDGWKGRGHGGFTDLTHVVWHHDASGKGNSPWVCDYMIRNWNTHGAQLWVSRSGEWHVLAAGVAYHAGRVRTGKPGNRQSLGVETDHTTGEDWPSAQIDSLRRGTAAILRRMGRDERHLEFHKTICDPPGRKTDPAGLSLPAERTRVARLLAPAPPAPAPEDIDMTKAELQALLDAQTAAITGGVRRRDETGAVIDTDKANVSNADLLSAMERMTALIVAAIKENHR